MADVNLSSGVLSPQSENSFSSNSGNEVSLKDRVADRLRKHREKLEEQLRELEQEQSESFDSEVFEQLARAATRHVSGSPPASRSPRNKFFESNDEKVIHMRTVPQEDDDYANTSIAARAKALMMNREQRRLEKLHKLEQSELNQLQDKPSINQNSVRMANSSQERRESDVGTRLYQRGLEQRSRLDQSIAEAQKKNGGVTPIITKQAAILVRSGDVGERLYNAAIEKNAKRKQLSDQCGLYVSPPPTTTSPTPKQCSTKNASPKSMKKGASLGTLNGKLCTPRSLSGKRLPQQQSALEYTNELHHKAMLRLKAQQDKVKLEAKLAQDRATPMLTAKSRELASELEPSRERLLRPKKSVSETQHDPELKFKPIINKRSKQIVLETRGIKSSDTKTLGQTIAPHERLHKEFQNMVERRKHLAQNAEMEKKEMRDCTFKPKISKSRQSFSKVGIGHTRIDNKGLRVEERTVLWSKQRRAKLEMQQRLKQEHDNAPPECTFRPNVASGSSTKFRMARMRRAAASVTSKQQRTGRDTETQHSKEPLSALQQEKNEKSIAKFVERQQKARDERKRIAEVHTKKGKSWTGALTVPKEPQFASDRRSLRKNLRKQMDDMADAKLDYAAAQVKSTSTLTGDENTGLNGANVVGIKTSNRAGNKSRSFQVPQEQKRNVNSNEIERADNATVKYYHYLDKDQHTSTTSVKQNSSPGDGQAVPQQEDNTDVFDAYPALWSRIAGG